MLIMLVGRAELREDIVLLTSDGAHQTLADSADSAEPSNTARGAS